MYWKCSLQALILALVVQTTAAGRQIEDWPFKKLFKEADLVVIATVISNSEAGDQVNDKAPDKKFLGILTTFQVESTLKGDVELKKIVVFHYILKLRDGESISNGPLLVSFHEKPIEIRTDRATMLGRKPEYMLFLKRRSDGRFECVSGQFDPSLSVKQIISPLP